MKIFCSGHFKIDHNDIFLIEVSPEGDYTGYTKHPNYRDSKI